MGDYLETTSKECDAFIEGLRCKSRRLRWMLEMLGCESMADVRDALTHIDGRELDVLCMRLGVQPYDRRHTLCEVGDKFGVTRERIRQIEWKAARKVTYRGGRFTRRLG